MNEDIGAILGITLMCFLMFMFGLAIGESDTITHEKLIETGHGEYHQTTGKFQLKEIAK